MVSKLGTVPALSYVPSIKTGIQFEMSAIMKYSNLNFTKILITDALKNVSLQ